MAAGKQQQWSDFGPEDRWQLVRGLREHPAWRLLLEPFLADKLTAAERDLMEGPEEGLAVARERVRDLRAICGKLAEWQKTLEAEVAEKQRKGK